VQIIEIADVGKMDQEAIAVAVCSYIEEHEFGESAVVALTGGTSNTFESLQSHAQLLGARFELYEFAPTISSNLLYFLFASLGLDSDPPLLNFHRLCDNGEFKVHSVELSAVLLEFFATKGSLLPAISTDTGLDKLILEFDPKEVRSFESFVKDFEMLSSGLYSLLCSNAHQGKGALFQLGELDDAEVLSFLSLKSTRFSVSDLVRKLSKVPELARMVERIDEILNHAQGFSLTSDVNVRQLVDSSLWLSAFYSMLSRIEHANQNPQVSFLLDFRALELFVDAILFEYQEMEIGTFWGEKKYVINDKKVLGFGVKWNTYKRRLSKELSLEVNRSSDFSKYIELRNSLTLIHGVASINRAMCLEFGSLVEGHVDRVGGKIWGRRYIRSQILANLLEAVALDLPGAASGYALRVLGIRKFTV